MSWNPLRKFSKTSRSFNSFDDFDLDQCISNLKELETVTRKLHKDAKKYEELILELSRIEQKMTEDLSSSLLCQEEDKLRCLVEEWHSFACGLSKSDADLVATLHQVLTDPIKRYCGLFPEIQLALKRHEQAVQHCDNIRNKLQKITSKEDTAPNLVKREQTHHSLNANTMKARLLLESLKNDLPTLYDRRVEYFQPTIEAVIQSEVNHWGEMTNIFGELVQDAPKQYSTLDRAQKERVSKLHSLSIVSGT